MQGDCTLKILVACEFSGTVRDAFIARGHDAMSCDLLPTEKPGPHYQGNVLDIINDGYDAMVAHPPCTVRNVASAWALCDPDFDRYPGVGYHQKVKPETLTGAARREARAKSDEFFRALLNANIPQIAIENPIGLKSDGIPKPSQIIQPHQFGHDASKATCLWLKGIPLLIPTCHVAPRMVNGKPRWANQTDNGQNRLSPSSDRWALRSLTYPGIAAAMAEQWGCPKPAETLF